MTLRDHLLQTLYRERKAIDAAIFLIESSDTLGAIEIEGVAAVESPRTQLTRRSTEPAATPPQPETEED